MVAATRMMRWMTAGAYLNAADIWWRAVNRHSILPARFRPLVVSAVAPPSRQATAALACSLRASLRSR